MSRKGEKNYGFIIEDEVDKSFVGKDWSLQRAATELNSEAYWEIRKSRWPEKYLSVIILLIFVAIFGMNYMGKIAEAFFEGFFKHF